MNGISLKLEDKITLYKMYMPFITDGALFFPTEQEYNLSDSVPVSLSFAFHPNKVCFEGKVIWITPKLAQGGKLQGIGLQFCGEEGALLKTFIEKLLGDHLHSQELTYTL